MSNGIKSDQYDYTLLKKIGDDTFISRNVEIRRPHLVSVGSHSAIDTGFYCTVSAEIGDYVHIAPYNIATGGPNGVWRMDHFSSLSAGCRIICGGDDHMGAGLVGPTIPEQFRCVTIAPVIFEKFANVGVGSIIMPGVTLAEGTVIGANSFVTKSTEPWAVYVGSPAKPVKVRPREQIIDYARQLGYEI